MLDEMKGKHEESSSEDSEKGEGLVSPTPFACWTRLLKCASTEKNEEVLKDDRVFPQKYEFSNSDEYKKLEKVVNELGCSIEASRIESQSVNTKHSIRSNIFSPNLLTSFHSGDSSLYYYREQSKPPLGIKGTLAMYSSNKNSIMVVRTVGVLGVALLVGSIFFQQPDDSSSKDARVNSQIFLMCVLSLFCLPAVTRYLEDRLLFNRERASGYYGAGPVQRTLFIYIIHRCSTSWRRS